MSCSAPFDSASARMNSRAPLLGRSICVTRAASQAQEFMAMLSAYGAEAVAVPTIDIISPPDEGPITSAITNIRDYAWIIFTSTNAVDRFFAYVDAVDARSELEGAHCAVVGAATAARLASYGIAPAMLPEDYKAEGLVEEFEKLVASSHAAGLLIDGQKILMPRALVAREILPQHLADLGYSVEVVPVYQTVPAEISSSHIKMLKNSLTSSTSTQGFDAVTFTSPSTANNFYAACEKVGLSPLKVLDGMVVFSIGAITTAALRKLGFEGEIIESEESTTRSLVDAIVVAFS